jgi:hypothetical protein
MTGVMLELAAGLGEEGLLAAQEWATRSRAAERTKRAHRSALLLRVSGAPRRIKLDSPQESASEALMNRSYKALEPVPADPTIGCETVSGQPLHLSEAQMQSKLDNIVWQLGLRSTANALDVPVQHIDEVLRGAEPSAMLCDGIGLRKIVR